MARDKQVNVLLTAETVEGLRAEAARSDVSLSEVVRGRIEGYPSAVADAEDWRRAAMARCADAESSEALRSQLENIREAAASVLYVGEDGRWRWSLDAYERLCVLSGIDHDYFADQEFTQRAQARR